MENKELKKIDQKIFELKSEIENLTNEIAEKKQKITPKRLKSTYEKLCVSYKDMVFDWDTGAFMDKIGDDYDVIKVEALKGEIEVFSGYDLANGFVLICSYLITINNSTLKMKKKFIKQTVRNWCDIAIYETFELDKSKGFRRFVNEFFDCDYNGQLSLSTISRAYREYPSLEVVLRSDWKDEQKDFFIREGCNTEEEKVKSLNEIVGLDKGKYKLLKEKGYLNNYIECLCNATTRYTRDVKSALYIPKSNNELLEILEYCSKKEKQLDKFEISTYRCGSKYYRNLYTILSYHYCNSDYLNKNYTFIKFMKYVSEEVINQGFNTVDSFITELRDYIRMCENADVKPLLYSSYLKQNHDLATRNLKVTLEEKAEAKFKGRYEEFKDIKINDDYYVVVPKYSNDLRQEGSNLGHCVASYINSVIQGTSLIFFLRKNKDKSLVTFEYSPCTESIVQERGSRNRSTNIKEHEAIAKWLKLVKEEKKEK